MSFDIPMPEPTTPPNTAMPHSHHNHHEPEERIAPGCRLINHGKHWKHYPPDWTARITRIAAIQERLQDAKALGIDWSDKQFAGELKQIKNVWASLRLGLYPLPTTATRKTKWLKLLDQLEELAKANLLRVGRDETAASLGVQSDYCERRDYTAIKFAISRAMERASVLNPDRIVGYVADTGFGKTAMINHLKALHEVNWSVEATPAWSKSYKALLLSLAEMWGLDGDECSELELEKAVLKHAKTLTGVVAMDELDTLNRQGWGLIKRLLNESMLVVVLFMTPQTHAEIMTVARQRTKIGSQLKQFLRRFEITIRASEIGSDEVQTLAPEVFATATSAQLSIVSAEANKMGGIDAIKRIAANVTDLRGRKAMTDEHLAEAVKIYRMAVPVIEERRAA